MSNVDRFGITDGQGVILSDVDSRAPNVEDPGPELFAPQEVSLLFSQRPRNSTPHIVLVGVDMCLDADRCDFVVRVCASALDIQKCKCPVTQN